MTKMRRLVLAVLFGVAASAPARAQTVTLDVCNIGAIDVDLFVSRAGAVSDSHLKPGTCQSAAKDGTIGIQEAYLGIAFVDSQGHWGAPRRFDTIPYMGVRQLLNAVEIAGALQGKTLPRPETLTAATRNASVRHGNATVTLPLQLLFQSSMAGCRTVPTGRSTSSYIGGRETVTREYTEVCEDIIYTMTVAAYADSREASLGRLPMGGGFEATPPGTGRRVPKAQIDWADLEAERKLREAPEAVSWNDLVAAFRRSLSRVEINSGQRFTMPRYIKVRGTVSAVEFRQHPVNDTTTATVAEINLRESPLAAGKPYPEFNVCTTRLDVLQEVFGADFRTSMIGKTIEVQGRPIGVCWGQAGEIEFGLARQVRPVESAQFAAGTRIWVPPATPASAPAPVQTPEQIDAQSASMANLVGLTKKREAEARLKKPCDDAMNAAFAAGIADRDPQAPVNKEFAACKARAAADAQREGERAEACARDLLKANPRMLTADIYAGVAACMQAPK